MVSSCRLSYYQHAHILTLGNHLSIRKKYLLGVALALCTIVSERIYRIRPRHKETAKFCGVPVYPWPVLHMCQGHCQDYSETGTCIGQKSSERSIFHLLHEDIYGGKNT